MRRATLKPEIVKALLTSGYDADSYGNYQKMIDGQLIRLKVQDTVLRAEYQIVYSDGTKEWIRKFSYSIKGLSVGTGGGIDFGQRK